MKIWVDDIRPAPEGYLWVKTVNDAKTTIQFAECILFEVRPDRTIELIDLDHDAGDYAYDGGDYIKILDWLEETGRNYPIRLHTMNPVGREKMRLIIEKNGWEEVR